MILTRTARWLLAVWLVITPLTVWAQDSTTPENGAEAAQEEPAVTLPEDNVVPDAAEPVPLPPMLMTDPEWLHLANRAEGLAASDDVSLFTIQRLRVELVRWRDAFLAETSANGGRIETVRAQIAALGTPAEGEEEPAAVADRRAELQTQLDQLRAPRLLAEEAYARANGIIAEFDTRVLRNQTAEITARGPSPLNPTYLLGAVAAVGQLVQFVVAETAAEITARAGDGRLWGDLPRAIIQITIGIVLLGIGRRYVTYWRAALAARGGRLLPVRLFLLSLIQIVVPLFGLFLLTQGLQLLGIFGLRGGVIIAAIPQAGAFVIFGWWLARHIFPTGDAPGYLGYDADTRAAGRRYGLAIAWVLAIGTLLDAGLSTLELDEGARAAAEWPFLALTALLFWLLGRVIKTTPPVEQEEGAAPVGRTRAFIGRACTIVAIVAPVLAAFGYVAAGRALLIPAILTVTLIAVILLIQRLVHDLSQPEDGETQQGVVALLPVFVSFVIYLVSLPVFALIWGARDDDLLEIWARFREGFAIGEVRISPTDFLTFALIFALGYMLTRFIQGTLRKSVLPRTRLDLGGQNAIVAGFGYVGIILAALVAITTAGIDLSNLAIVAGALSVGIGFGMQNIVSNFVSGIILLIERPISEGDWIEVGDRFGVVQAISVRSTRIETFDRTDVIIPNADLVSGQVTNWTRGNMSGRLIMQVGVGYGSDTDKVMDILKDITGNHPMVVMNPPPAVLFMNFGADALEFELRMILRDIAYIFVVRTEINLEINRRFKEAGIEIPFAQRDVWLRNPEALREDPA